MAQDQQTVSVGSDAYTQLTNSDATDVVFQALSGSIEVVFTTDATEPPAGKVGRLYVQGTGEDGYISDMAKALGVTAKRVWAKAKRGSSSLAYIDHA